MWDELSYLGPFPACNCEASKVVASLDSDDKLMQFLMDLSESCDHVKNQILLMDPLLSVNKA